MSRKKAAAAKAASAAAASFLGDHHDDDHGGMDDDAADKKGTSGFVAKIYRMVSDPATVDVVSWNERGDGFIVKDEHLFASQIMRSYFRHQNFSSFVRQLNFYGFRRCSTQEYPGGIEDAAAANKRGSTASLTSFFHPSFRKDHPELLAQIQRKATETKDAGLRDLVTSLSGEVAELRQQNEDLFKIQQRILYIFSRYMRATQTGQVGPVGGVPSGGPTQDAGPLAGKRIRGGNRSSPDDLLAKRPRLLMEARPDSPPHEYRSDTYSGGGRSNDYYDDASGNVVDISTDNYHAGGGSYQQHDPASAMYGAHSLSDLNWASDPTQTINDLITKSGGPLQQVLNSSNALPMQMGRAAPNTAIVNAQRQPAYGSNNYGAYAAADMYGGAAGRNARTPNNRGRGVASSSARGSGSGGAPTMSSSDSNFLDLGSQVGTNPRQLLELLDRMGADPSAIVPDMSPRGAARSSARNVGSGSGTSAARSSRLDHSSEAISGVFEDVPTLQPLMSDMASLRGRHAASAAASDQRRNAAASSAAAAASSSAAASAQGYDSDSSSYVPPLRPLHSGATLSPLEDDPPSFPLKSPVISPVLMPMPSSPGGLISPFIGGTLESYPHATSSSSYSSTFGDLPSPHPMSDSLTRQVSTDFPFGQGNTSIEPLTPTHMM